MKNYWKHIDDFFREKLGRYAETPPADVWESLESRLDALAPGAPVRKPAAYRWLKHLGMISVIAVLTLPLIKRISQGQAADAAAISAPIAANTVASATPAHTTSSSTLNGGDQAGRSQSAGYTSPAINARDGGEQVVPTSATTGKPVLAAAGNKPGNTKGHIAKAASNNHSRPGRATVAGKKGKTNPNAATIAYTGSGDGNESDILPGSGADNTHGPGMPSDEQAKKTVAELKKETPAAIAKANKEEAARNSKTNGKFEVGMKLGYERGRNDLAATKYVVSPYLQYNMAGKFSLMTQPAVKYASLTTHAVGSARSYIKTNDDGTVTQNGATGKGYVVEGGSITDSLFTTNYTYKQSHDSIVKSYTHGGNYLELELPILLKYAITPSLSVYGGVNIGYSQQNAIAEHTYTKQGIVRSMDSVTTSNGAPRHLAVADVIKVPGTSYTDYTAPVYSATGSSPVRIGYMAGFTYEYANRWLIDGLIQQTPVKPDLQGGYNTNAALSMPYFRLSVGYKFIK